MDRQFFLSFILILASASSVFAEPARTGEKAGGINLVRVPDGGIQPQVAMDDRGVLHMAYFRGEPAAGDLFYVTSRDGGATFSKPLAINLRSSDAIASGNIRGARIALGRNGRVHVGWMGSRKAEPKGPKDSAPMLYTRLNDAGTTFEPERNMIQFASGLDGGGTVAADRNGNVYVIWHAPLPGKEGEGERRVWIAKSTDDGKSFERERVAFDQPTGACGCCGMGAFTDRGGNLYVLYRSAFETMHRDIYLLLSRDQGRNFSGTNVQKWDVGHCVMSTQAFAEGPKGVVAGWETEGQAVLGSIDAATGKVSSLVNAPGVELGRKYPALAVNAQGDTLFAWTEGMGFRKGGAVAWQVFDKSGNPIKGERGRSEGVPAHSLVAAFARPDGGFTLVY